MKDINGNIYGINKSNNLCPQCLIIAKGSIYCGRCGSLLIPLSYKSRVPKKDAKKKEWKEFSKHLNIKYLKEYIPAKSKLYQLIFT